MQSLVWGGPEGLVRGAGFHLKYQIIAKVAEPGQSVTKEKGKRDFQIILKRTRVFLQVGLGKLTLSMLFYSSLLKFKIVFSKLNRMVNH